MKRPLRTALFLLIATVNLPTRASADFWTRTDRSWTNEELNKAIAFCRIQPRLNSDTGLLVDTIMGRQINKCMHALGWVGFAD
jgi:hypothetical protein